MAKLELSEALRAKLGPEHKMDFHWVDVKLRDGRKLFRLVVRGGSYLVGYEDDPNGERDLDFESVDIVALRPAALFRCWPLW